MQGKFILSSEAPAVTLDWGHLKWVSNPEATGAAHLTVIHGEIFPGNGHNFHHHPAQEEVIAVLAGQIEQWIGQDKKVLRAGDFAFIPAGVVHASFNAGTGLARLLAILGPSVAGMGIEQVDVSGDAPWRDLRQ
jgi:quercetin dioxygenase-like cupin family protein